MDKQKYWIHTGTFPRCDAHPIRKLQPAAKALEELLREAELKGLKFAREQMRDDLDPSRQVGWRIAELEKARAILEKKV